MKSVSILLLSLWVGLSTSNAQQILLGDTKDLYKQKEKAERFTWEIEGDRIKTLPQWKEGEEPPLSQSQAERIARQWTKRQPLRGELPARPYSIVLTQIPASFDNHYFYKVHYATKNGSDSFWTVHILMDGSIIEPEKSKQDHSGAPSPQ